MCDEFWAWLLFFPATLLFSFLFSGSMKNSVDMLLFVGVSIFGLNELGQSKILITFNFDQTVCVRTCASVLTIFK